MLLLGTQLPPLVLTLVEGVAQGCAGSSAARRAAARSTMRTPTPLGSTAGRVGLRTASVAWGTP